MTTGDRDEEQLEVIDLEESGSATARHEPATGAGLRGRRGPVVVAIVVVVALAGSAIANRVHDQKGNAAATGTTLAGQVAIGLDGNGANSLALFPYRVGSQLLTGGSSGLQLVDTDTGGVTTLRITGLPDAPVTVVAQSGGTVAVRVDARMYWFTMRDRIAYSVVASSAFPAARRGHLWLTTGGSATLVPGPSHAIPTNGPAIGATRAGLLVITKAGVLLQPVGSDLTAQHSRMFLRAPATVIGVHPDRVAWVSNECGVLRCPVHVTEVASSHATSSWLQLLGHPNPLVVAGATALFSPDGSYIAIVVPDPDVVGARTFVVADLRSRATTVVDTIGRFGEPARPGSDDATGRTADWTLDSRFLLLAPVSGTGPVGIVEPGTPVIVSSRYPLGTITSTAAIGTSARGPLDYPRHGTQGPIDTGGPSQFGTPGLSLIGVDDQQVDAVDLGTDRSSTWPVDGGVARFAASSTIARVTGGWLVVRNAGVYLLTGDAATASSRLIVGGSQVFSADEGRQGWIIDESMSTAESFDPATRTVGNPVRFSGSVAAIDAGLVVATYASEVQTTTALDIIDRFGNVQKNTAVIDQPYVEIVAGAGTTLAYRADDGLHLYDFAARTDRHITAEATTDVTLSPDGRNLAWIYADFGPPDGGAVRAMRIDGDAIAHLGAAGDRVAVANDGTVLFTNGVEVRRGQIDQSGSRPVYGLAPEPGAVLALG